ncbi:KpsF/GutQ family sugar-phosphate isomerase [Natronospora cellulosivora (SeqCode)]
MNDLLASGEISKKCIDEAKRVLEVEAQSILKLKDYISNEFLALISLILEGKGRVILSGVGKSGLIARKMAATFSSTGTPAFFVHAGEALHGDLGMVTNHDIFIVVSNSGETEEVLSLIPSLKRIGAVIVAFTGKKKSMLVEYADIVIFAGVEEEACPLGLAPTASTTAILAMGDAMALTVSKMKGFTPEDFALYHPGGSLGRKLLTKVKDVMNIRGQNPIVLELTNVKEALFTMTKSKMGSTSIINDKGILVGIITDGDIRRLLEKSVDFLEKPVSEVMTKNPRCIESNCLAIEALNIMEDNEVSDLPIVENMKPVGMLNFQDLLRAKIL